MNNDSMYSSAPTKKRKKFTRYKPTMTTCLILKIISAKLSVMKSLAREDHDQR